MKLGRRRLLAAVAAAAPALPARGQTSTLSGERQRVIAPAVERRDKLAAPLREFDFDDAVEPAVTFTAR